MFAIPPDGKKLAKDPDKFDKLTAKFVLKVPEEPDCDKSTSLRSPVRKDPHMKESNGLELAAQFPGPVLSRASEVARLKT